VKNDLSLTVANRDLRVYDPDNEGIRTQLLKVETAPTDCYGCSGIRLVLQPSAILDGYRPGGIVRIFAEKWPRGKWAGGALFGESLGNYRLMHSFEIMEPLPSQFPFRTDFGNEQLPWYQPRPDTAPPPLSEHRVIGELVKIDAGKKSGQFRTDRTGELVDFTLLPQGGLLQRTEFGRAASPVRIKETPASVLFHDTPGTLADLPLGTRCLFYLYQDEKGAFTRASLVMDMATNLALGHVTCRIEEVLPEEGKLRVVRHLPLARDYQNELCKPLDLGCAELTVDASTRVWKGNEQLKIADLAPGDDLLFNTTGRTTLDNGHCTEIWIVEDTQKPKAETAQK
jgi:hypothetical protein